MMNFGRGAVLSDDTAGRWGWNSARGSYEAKHGNESNSQHLDRLQVEVKW